MGGFAQEAESHGVCTSACCDGSASTLLRHKCWVCAFKETDIVLEPSPWRQLLNALEDGHWRSRRSQVTFSLAVAALLLALMLRLPIASADDGAAASMESISRSAVAAAAAAVLGTVVVVNTLLVPQNQDLRLLGQPAAPKEDLDLEAETHRDAALLSGAIRCATISHDDTRKIDYSQFLKFHRYLRDSFPRVHKETTVTVINRYSLLFEWTGSDSTLQPWLLAAHLDVVPTPDLQFWRNGAGEPVDPFAGKVMDGPEPDDGSARGGLAVWGRGAIDNKHNVLMQLQAVEEALAAGVKPRRTVYLAYGHDEEIGGSAGAGEIAKHLAAKGVELEFVLDEGAFILQGVVPTVQQPVAYIGNSEKGFVNIELSVDAVPSCHSSAPPTESSLGILSRAVAALERRPHPTRPDLFRMTLAYQASIFSLPLKLVIANWWCFGILLSSIFVRKPRTAAVMRTTTAITVMRSGVKVNLVPQRAVAYVNHRVHPQDSLLEVIERDRKIIGDSRVKLRVMGDHIRADSCLDDEPCCPPGDGKGCKIDVCGHWDGSAAALSDAESKWTPPSPVSSLENRAFRLLKSSVAKAFHAPVTPMVLTGNTDTRHYWGIVPSKSLYRFTPLIMDIDDVEMFHGPNERVSLRNLRNLKRFYKQLLHEADEPN